MSDCEWHNESWLKLTGRPKVPDICVHCLLASIDMTNAEHAGMMADCEKLQEKYDKLSKDYDEVSSELECWEWLYA